MPAPAAPAEFPARPWRFLPRTRRGWLVAIVVPPVLLLFLAYILARLTPPWYQPLDPTSLQVIDALAVGQDKIGPDLHNSLQRVPLGDQLWTISQTEINSVLAYRFAPPQNPDGTRSYPAGTPYPVVTAPFILFSPGKITIAARSTKLPGPAPAGGVASATFTVATIPAAPPAPPNGLIKLDGAWVGDLPVPKSLVESKARAYVPSVIAALNQAYSLAIPDPAKVLPQIDAAVLAMQRGEPFPLKFTYDRRVVIIKEIRVDDGSLSLIFGPESPAAVRPRPLPPAPYAIHP